MNQVQELTKDLALAIEGCEEYVRYQKAKQALYKYPILKKKADEFRKRNYHLQKSGTDIFDESEKLLAEYAQVIEHPIVWEYLNAEGALCRLVREVNWSVLENLDFEIGFV